MAVNGKGERPKKRRYATKGYEGDWCVSEEDGGGLGGEWVKRKVFRTRGTRFVINRLFGRGEKRP